MTRAQLVAVAGVVSGLAAGGLVLVNGLTGEVRVAPDRVLDVVNPSSCTPSACNATQCIQANNVLTDAGSPCVVGFGTCDVRVGPGLRDWAAGAGVTLDPQTYQRLRLVGMRCPVPGGFGFAVLVDDAGVPLFSNVTTQARQCVRAPVAGGTGCQRSEHDGGFRYFGAGNVFPVADSNGDPSCQPVACSVFFGDDPNTDL